MLLVSWLNDKLTGLVLTIITKLLQSSQINKKFDNEVVEKNKD